jgi:branched-chain amino acid transport system permease protein
MLLVALALILVNGLLIVFGPDAQGVQTSYSFASFAVGRLIVDANKIYAALAAALVVTAALFAFFRFAPYRARPFAPAPIITPGHWLSGSTSSISTR